MTTTILYNSGHFSDDEVHHHIDNAIKASKLHRELEDSSGGRGSPGCAAAGDPAPRSVIRGANCHVGIDWIRGSLPASQLSEVEGILSEFLGVALVEGRGRFNLDSSKRAGSSGVYFDSGHKAAFVVVDVAGGDLAGLPGDEQHRLLCRLRGAGLRCTRIDLPCDWRGEGLSLIGQVKEWCKSGYLVGARNFELFDGRNLFTVTRDGVSIGARGNDGSGRYVRVYDKGLEQKTAEHRCWVRWELEASDAVAREVVERLVAATDWRVEAAIIALGAFDFRGGDPTVRASRRERVAEWAAFLGGLEVERVVAPRVASTFNSWAKWMVRSVLPGAAALGMLMETPLSASQVLRRVESLKGSSASWLSSNKAVSVTQAMCHGVSGSELGAEFMRRLGASEAEGAGFYGDVLRDVGGSGLGVRESRGHLGSLVAGGAVGLLPEGRADL